MTDVMDAILNGVEGDDSIDETTVGEKSVLNSDDHEDETKEGESVEIPVGDDTPGGVELEDTTDSISSQTGANNLVIAMDDEEKDLLEGDDAQQEIINDEGDESKPELIEDNHENGDDSMMEIAEDGSKDGDIYGTEQQSNASLSPSAEGVPPKPSFKNTLMQNGVEETVNENSSSSSTTGENKTLLTGLLEKKESNSNPTKKSTSQQPSRSFSVSDGNAIAKELQEQVNKLNSLLSLKEKEWSAILRLKKHMEYALEQVKCTQRMAKAQEDEVNGAMTPTDFKACINLITAESGKFNLTEKIITESIENAETENESLQAIFPFRISSDFTAEESSDPLTASAALQKLCERKRKAAEIETDGDAQRPRRFIAGRESSSLTRKVFGPKGHMVNVQSIIETHRSGAVKPPQKQLKKSSLQMNPDRSYYKTLEELITIAKADRLQQEPSGSSVVGAATTSVPQISCTRSLSTPKPKNGKPAGRQTGSGSNSILISNATPSGSGTLAKMLSPSTHSTNRSINDGSTNSSQRVANKLPTSDANLSLANLLATSKMDTKPNIKIKKERVREDEASHVPTQQQADNIPICQGCNLSRAQFVCAGCANQWYCSRECQVAAWDEHSEICSG